MSTHTKEGVCIVALDVIYGFPSLTVNYKSATSELAVASIGADAASR